ncbi:MAG: hypothetical protein RIS64_4075 [Bacteroidota bacterium]|jgi:hypothetical protein
MKKVLFLIAFSLWGQHAMAQLFQNSNTYFEDVQPFSNQIGAVKINRLWHFWRLDSAKPALKGYAKVHPYHDGFALVLEQNRKELPESWQFCNVNGILVGEKYDTAHSFCNGFAAVKKKGKWGVINGQFKQVIRFKYDNIGDFYENRCRVGIRKNEALEFTMIDSTGKEISVPYPNFGRFAEGLAVVREDIAPHAARGYIDVDGSTIIECKKERVLSGLFSEGFAPVCERAGELSFISKTGQIEFSFEDGLNATNIQIHNFSDGRAAVKKNVQNTEQWGFINKQGQMIIEAVYDKVMPFSEGFASVCKDKAWYFGKLFKT